MIRDIDRILISREDIAAKVGEMARAIAVDVTAALAAEGHPLDEPGAEGRVVLIPIMTGALVFTADLIREMPLKLSLELVAVSSYPGKTTESKGARIDSALPEDLAGKHVILVDDILDSGRTLALVKSLIEKRGPASVRVAVLLDKKERRVEPVDVDHVGFTIPDEFVVGYGLDYDGYYRNLPDIAVLSPDAVSSEGA